MGLDLGLKPNVITSLAEATVRTSMMHGAGLWNLKNWRKGNTVLNRLGRAPGSTEGFPELDGERRIGLVDGGSALG